VSGIHQQVGKSQNILAGNTLETQIRNYFRGKPREVREKSWGLGGTVVRVFEDFRVCHQDTNREIASDFTGGEMRNVTAGKKSPHPVLS